MLIGFDVDGVWADFGGYTRARLGLPPVRDGEPYAGLDAVAGPALFEVIDDPATWVSLPLLPGAAEAADLLRGSGLPFMFVSHFPERFYQLRAWWLEDVARISPPVILVADADKAAAAQRHGITHFVEDKRANALALARAGIETTLVPAPYHQDGGDGDCASACAPAGLRCETLVAFIRRLREANRG